MQIRRPRGAPRKQTRPGTATAACLSLVFAVVLLLGAAPWPFASAAATAAMTAAPAQTTSVPAQKAASASTREHDAHCRCRSCRGGRLCCCLPKSGAGAPAANPFALRAVCDGDTPATLLGSPAWQPALPPARAAGLAPATFGAPVSYLVPINTHATSRAAAPLTPPPQFFLA